MPTVNCQNCGKPFHVAPSVLRRGYGKFCSPVCAYESRGEAGTRADNVGDEYTVRMSHEDPWLTGAIQPDVFGNGVVREVDFGLGF
ncbi:hypothetical protein [Halodesulfovibrio aestuarii]|uniref:Uncharacterized protein n=1 Tax=Halodesulfovibrio aestuarii TaxID=126333 RepID=A0ABV4JWN1_9BACT